ncbi:MAG: DegV family protein [Oscillospiraceae bacterium]
MSVKIIVDSTCDITRDFAKVNDIKTFPLKVLFGEKEYIDDIDLTREEFYEKLSASKTLPTTSQVAPDEFAEYFEAEKAGGDEVVGIFISSTFSGTFQSAKIAKEMTDFENAYLVDSRCATVTAQILVDIAIKMRNEGKTAREIFDALEVAKEKVKLYAIVDDLKNLKKGGRLSGAGAIIGAAFHVKPIITIDHEAKLVVAGKAKGRKSAVDFLLQKYKEEHNDDIKTMYIGNSGCSEFSKELEDIISQSCGEREFIESAIGAVIATHLGVNCVVIGFVAK